MTRNKLISIPAHYCDQKPTMDKCNNQLYPYCVWSFQTSTCIQYTSKFVNETYMESALRIQNLTKTTAMPRPIPVFDLTNKIESQPYNSKPLISEDTQLGEDIKFRVNASKEVQFTLHLGTFISLAIVFVAVSSILGSVFTIFLLKCLRSKKQQFTLKQIAPLSSFFAKKSLTSMTSNPVEEPIDKFENLYSKVLPKKRLSTHSIPDCHLVMAPEVSNYSAITELITQQYHEPGRYTSMSTSEIQPYSTQGEVTMVEANKVCLLNNRFLDYDESEYFTVKKSQLDDALTKRHETEAKLVQAEVRIAQLEETLR